MKQIRQPDDEDRLFWSEITQNIKKTRQPETVPDKPVILKDIKPDTRFHEICGGQSFQELSAGIVDNIDANTARRFRRCEFPVEGTLDLHGYTEENAFNAVHSFITSSYLQNKRCVLIITGKGLSREETTDVFAARGILKERVPQWLNSRELRPLILSFVHPLSRLGGSGALYILLRRKR